MYFKRFLLQCHRMSGLKKSTRHTHGFTIVELLIVIVVVGILAVVTIVSYNGVQVRALNASKTDEIVSWDKLFEMYKTMNGTYPSMADGGYCLGTGFPDTDSDSVGECRDLYYAPNRYSENTTLKNMISTVGKVSVGTRSDVHSTMGPYVEYHSPTLTLVEVIQGSSTQCPSPTKYLWDDGGGMLLCGITHNLN